MVSISSQKKIRIAPPKKPKKIATVSKLQSGYVNASGIATRAQSALLKTIAVVGRALREIIPANKAPNTEAIAIPVKTTADHFATPSSEA
ncbi:unannotated protein [freshwater metagenome]|uniref:Unannotated protein n=1 Tax=freshwater metagenome TaxID=449393 RepID=A0A6J6PF54_9ZZZZ